MIPDPSTAGIPFAQGGSDGQARDGSHEPSRAGQFCWLCGYAIINPPQIIGHWTATQARVAHRHCLQVLGELDLNLAFPPSSR